MRKRIATKAALALSVCMLILWAVLGTGSTLTWFVDSTPTIRNTMTIPELDVEVEYKNDRTPNYQHLESEKAIFNDQAIYEPGYTQVVYLRITNKGDIPFQYKLSVSATDYNFTTNVLGGTFCLPSYLRFGVIFGADETELNTKTRALAQNVADQDMVETLVDWKEQRLSTYSEVDSVTVQPGETRYAALVVYMPEEVGNEANYRGEAPWVKLGVSVYAQQADAPLS